MKAPQIIWICLMAISLLLNARLHGDVPKKKYNFWISLMNVAIQVGLLIWGGFFS